MRSVLAAPIVILVAGALPADVYGCDLNEFDQDNPPSESDRTLPTGKSSFEWGSDLDPWGNPLTPAAGRSWHFVRNLHEDDLSLDWEKPGLVVPFDKPLAQDYTSCAYDYGSTSNFSIDYEAPIITSNDGEKAAVAFVKNGDAAEDATPSVTGAEIRSDYTNESGNKTLGIARIILYYYSSDEFLMVDIFSGPGEEKMGFNPQAIGVDTEDVVGQLTEIGVGNIKAEYVDGLIGVDEFTHRIWERGQNGQFVMVAANEPVSLEFNHVKELPTDDTDLLLFSPSGSLVAAKKFSMKDLSREN